MQVSETDNITLDGQPIYKKPALCTILVHKPVGYVCSRNGQGSPTVYDLLPEQYHSLKTVGRLDKDSSGLILMTNDGELAHTLTHPSFAKKKIYTVTLNQQLAPLHQQMINDHGITLNDGLSRLQLEKLNGNRLDWQVTMEEGRNRQIRRTFSALGYTVTKLHRIQFGQWQIQDIKPGTYREVDTGNSNRNVVK